MPAAYRIFLLVALSFAAAACTSLPSPASRRQNAEEIAYRQGWHGSDIQSGTFNLRSYQPANPLPAAVLTIYIEGDGLAWISGSMPSSDPTPVDPLALRLALSQPDGNAAYLGRPCQYTGAENCAQKYWTHSRFAPEVIDAMNQAVDQLKKRFSAESLQLVGYSGGGAIAALIAQRRNDVAYLLTVAGNLDHAQWTSQHRISPLSGSLNPADGASSLKNLRQLHLVGGDDKNIPPAIAQSFVLKAGLEASAVKVLGSFDHRCCWAEQWPAIWAEAHP